MMASVRTALFLLPPVSVLLVAAVRCLCRVAARKLSALARAQFPSGGSSSSPSFRYYLPVGVEKQGGDAAMRELPVALYYRRRRSCCGEEQDEEQQQAAECVFCLSVIEEGSEVREVKCRHLFHRCCLDRWLLARPLATCPLCRCRLLAAARAPWEEDYGEGEDSDSDSDSDMMLFMACVHSRSSWLWPS
ncbi:hypothetical protein SEVIR_2G452200v4 [Setaria viridis]|uniref:RING-type domain-containing protein n=1 Tax=Setaria viridis TaxID=4556 RepID=A0A4U6W4G6_SETVI|nr:E3 ubiquitin-protein ligase EL5-like [Setaria viridis]TKW36625.1 hypothetical protein SEVIR_2G452200v2 [Setaria viridis]